MAELNRGGLVRRAAPIVLGLVAANIAAWAWALAAFHDYPLLLGTAALAYSFGLRHAFDADHIAAIDNVTRKLMQDGQRPMGVGLYFSLGHSTVVVLASIGIVTAVFAFADQLEAGWNHRDRGVVGVPADDRGGQPCHPAVDPSDVPAASRR